MQLRVTLSGSAVSSIPTDTRVMGASNCTEVAADKILAARNARGENGGSHKLVGLPGGRSQVARRSRRYTLCD